jgi:hypothetical protein
VDSIAEAWVPTERRCVTCGQQANWHVILQIEDAEAWVVFCAGHLNEFLDHETQIVDDYHPVLPTCGQPGTAWHGNPDEMGWGYCAIAGI